MNYILAAVPLLIPTMTAIGLLENPQALAERWLEHPFSLSSSGSTPSVSSQLLAYSAMGIFGYLLTNRLIPNIKVRPRGIWNRWWLLTVLDSQSHYVSTKWFACITFNIYRNILFEKEYAGKI